jgi:hypothetical protein
VLLVAAACAVDARAQAGQRAPHIGYLYPGGGRQGTTVRVMVGGQFLRGAQDVHLSGEGVRGEVIKHYPPLRNLDADQRREFLRRLIANTQQRWAELHEAGRVDERLPWEQLARGLPIRRQLAQQREKGAEESEVKLPDHPMINDLRDRSLRELLHIWHGLRDFRKRQLNVQIGETVLIELTIDRDAPLAERELRLRTRLGLTNPMVFQVSAVSEVKELEPNGAADFDPLPDEPPAKLPVVFNGQIMPGDIDRFRFEAEKGQPLVIAAHAKRLVPYLADAVPGWFQATLSLYDAQGQELAYVDDFRFDPDPVLLYEIPADGEYEIEIRDALYRGREDFVYRISVGEQPFITSVFPLGTHAGGGRYVSIEGWNLGTGRLHIDAADASDGVGERAWGRGRRSSNPVAYAVDPWRGRSEAEVNDTVDAAQRVSPPLVVNGCIERPGDVDVFRFTGRSGDEVVVEVVARRVRSPLDSLLRLMDASGTVLAWNDDHEHKSGFLHTDMGTLTHHADSYLRAELPTDGTYSVQLSDVQGGGGAAYGYRVRIGPPRPDFGLRVTPSSINASAGRATPICVYVLRKDGFDGEIEVALEDAPAGFRLDGARIPAGRDRVRMTLTAPWWKRETPVELVFVGRARIGGEVVVRRAVPADDVMQAFLYRHLVPSRSTLVAVVGPRRYRQPLARVGPETVHIPAGGSVEVKLQAPGRPRFTALELALSDPPVGIGVRDVTLAEGALTFVLEADRAAAAVGLMDNLIVEAYTELAARGQGGDGAGTKRRVLLGVLPAIPIEVVSP